MTEPIRSVQPLVGEVFRPQNGGGGVNHQDLSPHDTEETGLMIAAAITLNPKELSILFWGGCLLRVIVSYTPKPYSNYSGPYIKQFGTRKLADEKILGDQCDQASS